VTLLIEFADFYNSNIFTASYIKVCKKDDPKLGTCLRKSITSLRPYLSSGIKELDIPALNPLVIPEIKISHNAGAINLESAYKNIVIFGATRFRLRKVQVDLEQNKFRCKMWFPGLTMEGEPSVDLFKRFGVRIP
jgi:hypothetical protein